MSVFVSEGFSVVLVELERAIALVNKNFKRLGIAAIIPACSAVKRNDRSGRRKHRNCRNISLNNRFSATVNLARENVGVSSIGKPNLNRRHVSLFVYLVRYRCSYKLCSEKVLIADRVCLITVRISIVHRHDQRPALFFNKPVHCICIWDHAMPESQKFLCDFFRFTAEFPRFLAFASVINGMETHYRAENPELNPPEI